MLDYRGKLPRNPNPSRVYGTRNPEDIKLLVLHCDDWDADLEVINDYDVTPSVHHHISKDGCPGFTYHFFIEKLGGVFYVEDIRNITWHAGNWNGEAVGACIRYKATGNPQPPPVGQMNAAATLFAQICLALNLNPTLAVKGHRELEGTGWNMVNGVKELRKTCPGSLVNMDVFRKRVVEEIQTTLTVENFPCGEIDGIFGVKTASQMHQYILSNQLYQFLLSSK